MSAIIGTTYRTIADDEVAMFFAPRFVQWRRDRNLLIKTVAEMFGIGTSSISRFQHHPDKIGINMYDIVAKRLGWPLYKAGRTMSEYLNDNPNRQAVKKEGESRQVMIDFNAPSPAESFISWFDSQEEKLRVHVNILASFYETTPESITKSALASYIKKRQDIIDRHEKLKTDDAELRWRFPQ